MKRCALQRLPPGLALTAREENRRLELLDAEGGWMATVALEADSGGNGMECDASLEIACRQRFLEADEVRMRSLGEWLSDSGARLRLVINHGVGGDLLQALPWRAEGLSIALRPWLEAGDGPEMWRLAQRLECRELRILSKKRNGGWEAARMEHPSQMGKPGGETRRAEKATEDRYAVLARAVPTRLYASPYLAADSSSERLKMDEYRLEKEDRPDGDPQGGALDRRPSIFEIRRSSDGSQH